MWIDVLIKENSNEISHLYEFIIKLRRMSGSQAKIIYYTSCQYKGQFSYFGYICI